MAKGYYVQDGLKRMREMITQSGLSDLMLAPSVTRVEEETRERRARADVAEVAPIDEDEMDSVAAPELAGVYADEDETVELSGRMQQFAGTVPDVFKGGITAAAALEIDRNEATPEARQPDMRANDAEVDAHELAVLQRRRRKSAAEVEVGDAAGVSGEEMRGLNDPAGRRRETAPGVQKSSESIRSKRAETRPFSPIVDHSVPEVSVDASVDGIAGRSRRWLEMDDEVVADMMRRREAMVERGR